MKVPVLYEVDANSREQWACYCKPGTLLLGTELRDSVDL